MIFEEEIWKETFKGLREAGWDGRRSLAKMLLQLKVQTPADPIKSSGVCTATLRLLGLEARD